MKKSIFYTLYFMLVMLPTLLQGATSFGTGGVVTWGYAPDTWSYTTVTCASSNPITSITISMENTTILSNSSGIMPTSTFASLGTNPLVNAFIFSPGISDNDVVRFVKGIAFSKGTGETSSVSIVVDANPTNLPAGATITTWEHPDGTTHYYVFVAGRFQWEAAYNNAKSFYFQGRRGYLATITSAAEDATLVNISTTGGWSGGIRTSSTINDTKDRISAPNVSSAAPTNYSWACGPETGFNYYRGPAYNSTGAGPLNGAYSKWLSTEPNNQNPENCMQINAGGSNRTWNDLHSSASGSTTGYLIEFGGSGAAYSVGSATYPDNSKYLKPDIDGVLTNNDQWHNFDPGNVAEAVSPEIDPSFKTIRAAGGTPGYVYYQSLRDAINDAQNNDVIMALDNVIIGSTDPVIAINGKTITLTTAETIANDASTLGFPYRNTAGLDGKRATLTRGRIGHLLSVTGTGQLILKDIILDGDRFHSGSGAWKTNAGGSLVSAQGAGLTVSNVVLKNNITNTLGAAINANKIVMTNSEILNNESAVSAGGAGLYLTQSTGNTIDRSIFIANKAANHGGGIQFASTSAAAGALKINNCLIAHNEVTGAAQGAGFYNPETYKTNVEIVNSTIVMNKTNTELVRTGLQGAVMKNCVVWGNNNTAGNATAQAYTVDANYCATVTGGFNTGTNTNSYTLDATNTAATGPNFEKAGTVAGIAGYVAGTTSYALTALTPFINRGNNADAPVGTDLAGKTRIFGGDGTVVGVIDMGAYEQIVAGARPVTYSAGTATTAASDTRSPAVSTWNLVYYNIADIAFTAPLSSRPTVNGDYVIRAEDTKKHWVASNVYSFTVTPIRYITETGAGFKTGISWADAGNGTQLNALSSEAGVAEIWIAKGTHNVTTAASVTTANIKVYGGFLGTETGTTGTATTPARDWVTNVTTIKQTAAFRAFDIIGAGVTIDGLTITGGNSSTQDGVGLHIASTATNAIIQNCTIIGNTQTTLTSNINGGGGIYIRSGATNAQILNCKITNNKTAANGAGIYVGATATITDCEISNNNTTGATGASRGAGIALYTNATVNNCRIFENFSTNANDGTGIYVGGGTVALENLLVYRNRNGFGSITAGAGTINGKNLTVVSNDFANSGTCAGLGLWGSGTATIYNSIFAFNNSPSNADINRNSQTLNLYNSFYGFGTAPSTGTSNITTVGVITDHFVNPIAYNVASTGSEDFKLKPTSTFINRGNNANIPSGKDLAGNPRIWNPAGKTNGVIDVGAYEQTDAGVRVVDYTPTSFVYNGTVQIPTAGDAATDNRLPVGSWGVTTVYTNSSFTTVTTTPTTPATYYVKSVESNGHWIDAGSSYTIVSKTYTVTFNINGGDGGTMNNQSLSFSSATTMPLTSNAFTKSGNSFAGWSLTPGGEAVYGDQYPMAHNTFATQGGTLNLYAVWVAGSSTVLFNNNTISSNGDLLVGTIPGVPASVTPTFGAAMPSASSVATFNGYTFMGYYDTNTATGGTQYYTSMMASAHLWDKSVATILYARWDAINYVVTFNANGGTAGTPATNPTKMGATMPSLTTAPTRTGYTFEGYYDTNAATGGTQYYTASLASARVFDKAAPITLYARWSANTSAVSLNGNTISSNGNVLIGTPTVSTAAVSVTFDAAMSLAGSAPTLVGYTFDGYYDTNAATGGTQYYSATMSSVKNWDKTTNTTLYARWIPNTYTVTLDLQGGTGGTSSITVTYGAAMPTATSPTKSGSTFAGYYTTANGVGTQYYNSLMTSVKVWDKPATATLYVSWAGTIRYITVAGAGTKTGISWANAGDGTQIAELANSLGVTEVWIAHGEHPITVEQVITSPGIKIYGGFIGGEGLLSARNFTSNITTIKQTAAASINSRVFKVSANDVLIDGFTITGGKYLELGSGTFRRDGGGILLTGNDITVKNCIVTGNDVATAGYGSVGGGGISITGTGATIDNCEFTNNTITRGNTFPSLYGAGIGVFGTGATIKNSKINYNSINSGVSNGNGVVMGGGIYAGAANCVIESCIVEGNTLVSLTAANTSVFGGGIYAANVTGIEINNTQVVKNSSKADGGGIYVNSTTSSAGAVKINNCLIAHNEITSTYWGAGIFNNSTYKANVEVVNATIVFNKTGTEATRVGLQGVVLKNSIVWGNATSSNTFNAQAYDINASYCASTGFSVGTNTNHYALAAGNTVSNGPNFTTPGTLGAAGYIAGTTKYTLATNSPLINRGFNPDALLGTDIAGNPRVWNPASVTDGIVDIGAYEQTAKATRGVTYTPTSFVYNNTAQQPTADDATTDTRLPAGTWSVAVYSDAGFTTPIAAPIAPATYYVKITDGNGHWVETSASYNIVVGTFTVDPINNVVYNGNNQQIAPTVKIGGTTLTANADYTVGYSADIKNVGTVTVTVTGINGYAGTTKTVTYNITKAPLTVTANPHSIVYGAAPAHNAVAYAGFVGSETSTVLGGTLGYTYNYTQYGNVGSYTITPNGLTSTNYNITFTTGALTVTQKPLTFTITATNKVYDKSTAATISIALTGLVNSDAVTATGTGTFANFDVGVSKVVSVTGIALAGAKAGNYSIAANTGSASANITGKPVTLSTTATKIFDGTGTVVVGNLAKASWANADNNNIISGDVLTITALASANYSTSAVHTSAALAAQGTPTWGGTNSGNYTITFTISTGSITATGTGTFTVTAINNVVYNGNNQQIAPIVKDGGTPLTSGTHYTVGYSADIKNVGAVTVTVTGINGYAGTTKTVTYNITKAPLTVTANPHSIVYGAAPAHNAVAYAGFVNSEPSTVLGGTLGYTYNYTQYGNVGSYTITPNGLTSNNYNITFTTGVLTVTQKSLTFTITATNKVYDKSTAATISIALTGLVNSDAVTATGTGTFANFNVGVSKTVSVTGIALVGAKAGNYSITTTIGSTSADITNKPVTLSTTATKIFDGNANVIFNNLAKTSWNDADNTDIISGDVLTITALASATYSTSAVHTSAALTAQGTPTWGGTNFGNYMITFTISTGDITNIADILVTFDLNAPAGTTGTLGTPDVLATYPDPMPAGATAPTCVGYIFVGYFDMSTGGNQYYKNDMTSFRNWDKTVATTLYAQWLGASTAVSYDITTNGGVGSVTPPFNVVTVGSPMPTITGDITKIGYDFNGFFDAATDGVQYYDQDYQSVRNWDKEMGTILYAQFVPKRYQVTLSPGSGVSMTGIRTFYVFYDSIYGKHEGKTDITPLPKPTKVAHGFDGWFTALDETGILITEESKVTTTSDITLYAKFTLITLDLLSGQPQQILCIGTPIEPIVYHVKGTKNFSLHSAPQGVNAVLQRDSIIISGIPLVSGVFNAVLIVGDNVIESKIYLSVKPESKITLMSDISSEEQVVLTPNSMSQIEYKITNADSVKFTNIPKWLTYNLTVPNANKEFTLSIDGQPNKSGLYHYNFNLVNGCGNAAGTGTISVVPLKGEVLVVTPNGDGVNDILEMEAARRYPENELTVYNRKGNIIYQKKNYNNDFDGSVLSNGIYIYIFKYIDADNKEQVLSNSITVTQ